MSDETNEVGELDHEAMQAEIDKALAAEAEAVQVPAEETAAGEVPAGAEAEASSPPPEEPFIGKWKKEEVVSLLERLEQFDPSGLRANLERALSGHLGQMGQRVKALEAGASKEWSFDPEALAGVKELDEGLYEKMVEGLQKGLRIQSKDPVELFRPMLDEALTERDAYLQAQMSDAVEERLLLRFVPDAYNTVQTKEWEAFYGKLNEQEREALQNWNRTNEQGQRLLGLRNAEPVLALFERFNGEQAAVKKEAERNEKRLAGNVRAPAAKAPAGPAGFSMKDRGEYDPDEAQRVIDEMLRTRT